MSTTNTENTLIVHPILNAAQPLEIKIKIKDDHTWLDLHLQRLPADFDEILTKLKETFMFKKKYKVIFNYHSIPQKWRDYAPFKCAILEQFSNTDSMQSWLELITHHCKNGKHPKFENFDDPITLQKIHNYFTSILNRELTTNQTKALCFDLLKN